MDVGNQPPPGSDKLFLNSCLRAKESQCSTLSTETEQTEILAHLEKERKAMFWQEESYLEAAQQTWENQCFISNLKSNMH